MWTFVRFVVVEKKKTRILFIKFRWFVLLIVVRQDTVEFSLK